MKHNLAIVPPDDLPEGDPSSGVFQACDAIERMHLNRAVCPRLPWDTVHDVIGPILPWQWWLLCAKQGNGKTMAAMNIVDDMVNQGRKVYVLPLEQSPVEMRRLHAALRLNLRSSAVLGLAWDKLPPGSREAVEQEIIRQAAQDDEEYPLPNTGQVKYSPLEYVSVRQLEKVWEAADDWDADLIVIDHIHRLADADHQELARVAKALTGLTKHGLPALVTGQLNRGDKDPLRPYLPPSTDDIQGSAYIEQEAHVILGLYRPLMDSVTPADLLAVRGRKAEARTLAKQNAVGLKVLKHRVDGEHTGRLFELEYRHGRIVCPETEDRKAWANRNDL